MTLRGIVNAGMAYDLLKQGCEVAGGLKDPTTVGEGLSSLALGGKDQLDVGCTKDEHCPSDNPCLGQFFCNAANACELISNTKPVCNDNIKVRNLSSKLFFLCTSPSSCSRLRSLSQIISVLLTHAIPPKQS